MVDLIIGLGQSNMSGHGDASKSPQVGAWAKVWNGKEAIPMKDPIPPASPSFSAANTGCCIPAFANEWHRLTTGSVMIYIHAAKGGSSLLPDADYGKGNWSPAGTLYGSAVDQIKQVREKFPCGRVICLWCQGENEVSMLGKHGVSGIAYQKALHDLVLNLDNDIGISRFAMSVTADRTPDQQIRGAQLRAVFESRKIIAGYQPLINEDVHYNQERLNLMGEELARNINRSYA